MPINEPNTKIDITMFDRFDANTGATQLKISTTGVAIKGKGLDRDTAYAIYLNKAGTIIAIKPDPDGLPIVNCAHGVRRVCCSRFCNALLQRGAEIPQTVDVEWDEPNEAWIGRLKAVIEPSKKGRAQID